MTAVELRSPNPLEGCVDCGSQLTVQLHPFRGRLCTKHVQLPNVPDGAYRPEFAEHLVDLGRIDAAWAYLAGWLMLEAARRYGAAMRQVAAA